MTHADRFYRYIESMPDGATARDGADWSGLDPAWAAQECNLLAMRGRVTRTFEEGRGRDGYPATVYRARGRQALIEEIAHQASLRFPFVADGQTWQRLTAFILACADDARARPGQNHYWWMKPPHGAQGENP